MSGAGRIEGKVAVVTGAGSGLGRETAILFAAEGANVVVADWDEAVARETAGHITGAGGSAIPYVGDVSEPEVSEDMIRAAAETYGGLDILHNNVFGTVFGKIADIRLEDWNRSLKIMLTSYFLGTKYAIPQMLKRGGGAIVNTASVAGLTGDTKYAAYAAAKHAVIGLTKVTSSDYACDGIRANAVCPGSMATTPFKAIFEGTQTSNTWFELATPSGTSPPPPTEERLQVVRQQFRSAHPVGDVADPADVARVVLFLASHDARNVTGQTVVADGGMLARSGTPDLIFTD